MAKVIKNVKTKRIISIIKNGSFCGNKWNTNWIYTYWWIYMYVNVCLPQKLKQRVRPVLCLAIYILLIAKQKVRKTDDINENPGIP